MNSKLLFSFLVIFGFHTTLKSQCVADEANVTTFTFEERTYEIVKETKTWENAKQCAIERGGYLVEINSQEEQDKIWEELVTAGLVDNRYVEVTDGGGASYIWIGANDKEAEGGWTWTGSGINFWAGAQDGSAVEEAYHNWGTTTGQNEPDNFGGSQHAAAIGLTGWPLDVSNLGIAGQWNDIDEGNQLYFIIEKDAVVAPETFKVTTKNATRITPTKATLHGEILNEDSLVIVERGFMYQLYQEPPAAEETLWTEVLIGEEVTTLVSVIENLTAETKYEFYAFAKVEGEDERRNGERLDFTTKAEGSVIAFSDSVGSIKPESVILYGSIEGTPADGVKLGFKWGKAEDLNFPGEKHLSLQDTIGYYEHRVSGLTPNTEYIFYFYVGEEKGEEIKFTTPGHTPYAVSTNDAEVLDTLPEVILSATITQKGTYAIPVYTFEYKPSTAEEWISTGNADAEFKATVRRLVSNTQYTFRAVVTTPVDTIYGDEKTFTSPTILGIFSAADNIELSVYPNPATSYVNVKIAAVEERSELLLVSMVGQIVKRYEVPVVGEYEEFVLNIPVNDLTRGIYYVKIGSAIQKVMVE